MANHRGTGTKEDPWVLKTPPGDGVAEMAEMLKSSQSEDAGLAIEYIGRQKVGRASCRERVWIPV